jgi:hypothetical protein
VSYVNVGARVSGERPASKAALRRALTSNPGLVQFDTTSQLGTRPGSMAIDATTEDIGTNKLSVCGPDPYTKRKWYATVEVRNGKIQIS